MMRLVKLVLLFLGFSFVIGLSAYVTVVFLIDQEETVIVPDLIGRDVVYGLELLTDLGLDIKVRDSEYSDAIPNHHVIDQYPRPGREIKKGRDVSLFLSRGPQYSQLPDLRGNPLEQARLILEANGLHAGVVSEIYHEVYAPRVVIAQEPAAGGMVARGEVVNLLMSRGERPVAYIMPDLSGLAFSSAVLRLEEMGLQPGQITPVADDRFPRNTVVGQDPETGHRVVEGDRVDLTINRALPQDGFPFSAGGGGVRLFRYRLEKGFLNRHIRILLSCYGLSVPLIDGFKRPGQTLWVLVPAFRDASLLVYVDRELVETEVFSGG